MVTCADTSFLFALYGNDAHTPRAVKWTKARRSPVTVTVLNEYELANALRFAECRAAVIPLTRRPGRSPLRGTSQVLPGNCHFLRVV